ncbi:hypothetical protein KFK09_008220 [Dendrobium nobile]|uniref:Uncharacterized protein n=1 Tax=Dendrobium nobile TaxID=94219 RepID=A0A8T3BMI7_DENNO|nr:hypothetical protein KFK09_008220 [Dendrobium nobile]
MATRIAPSPLPAASLRFQISERLSTKSHALFINPYGADKKPSLPCRASQSDNVAEEQSATGYESGGDTARPTIREQLAELTRGRDEDFTLQLGKKMKESLKKLNILTVSQRRNIKRQTYLNEVSRRNDVTFFATIGAFILLPPLVILAAAIQTGYVQLFP